MEITLSTPALLFPAVSLLLLAYTNRFVTLANLIRTLHAKYQENPNSVLMGQIQSLRYRVNLIKLMQAAGVSSILVCVLCMFMLFAGLVLPGKVLFGISLLLMALSLTLSLREIWVSVEALNIHLGDLEVRESGRKANASLTGAARAE